MDEFELIKNYFEPLATSPKSCLGIGDDCAVLIIPKGHQLLTSTDALVEGVHFPKGAEPACIASRCLGVNISDIAAMGGQPRWYLLALTVPTAEPSWLKRFSSGLKQTAAAADILLIGGDTNCGPLNISIHIMGLVPEQQALKRSGAVSGDAIWVTGTLGNAAWAVTEKLWALNSVTSEQQQLLQHYWYPQPPVEFSCSARHLIHSCIDISDGLLADLTHICRSSEVGACLNLEAIPISEAAYWQGRQCEMSRMQLRKMAVTLGDDYQLCFTAPQSATQELGELAAQKSIQLSCIGEIERGSRLSCRYKGQPIDLNGGYTHF